ncbi:hypothetical protein EHF33_12670 [Deinococcus psychrotolerans]|uniref:Uncharacterized protein n=1 Tax=Deinococcus psychrotolerans TaxID=2489213 RepID=A0A3G8YF25_9DEIO|nr:hypothetical protein [Deinococcus psychrotolerans]AZI43490.1 hypothetical protein EHF33_12670 [Deinococcus psychrotolerans]
MAQPVTDEGQRQAVNVLAFAAAGLSHFLAPQNAEPWATLHLQLAAAPFHLLDVQTMRHAFPIIGGSAWYIAALEAGPARRAAQLAACWAVSSLVAGVTQPYEDGEAEAMLDTLLTSYTSLVPLRLN